MAVMASFQQKLGWIRQQMPRLQRALAALPDMCGVRLACSMHLDIKMVPLIEGLLERNTAVFLTACNPMTVRDEVVDHLVRQGAEADARHAMSPDAYRAAIDRAVGWEPTHLCEMGAALTAAIHEQPRPTAVRASLEATASGINRLDGLAPRYPIFDWDDIPLKEGLHNRHMVGLTTWHTFFQTTHLTLHEKQVLVVGYGLVGRGLADSARHYGGTVTVVENDPVRAIEARYAGYAVASLDEALPRADVVVTATGAERALSGAHLGLLGDGAFLLNAGHTATEIDVAALRAHPHRTVLPFVEAIQIGSRTVYLLASGFMFNLVAGGGDGLNAFDVTLAVLTSGIGYMVREGAMVEAGVHVLPEQAWRTVAA